MITVIMISKKRTHVKLIYPFFGSQHTTSIMHFLSNTPIRIRHTCTVSLSQPVCGVGEGRGRGRGRRYSYTSSGSGPMLNVVYKVHHLLRRSLQLNESRKAIYHSGRYITLLTPSHTNRSKTLSSNEEKVLNHKC